MSDSNPSLYRGLKFGLSSCPPLPPVSRPDLTITTVLYFPPHPFIALPITHSLSLVLCVPPTPPFTTALYPFPRLVTMTSAPAPSHHASLLSGLRTGGVRSNLVTGVPHTAAPGALFNMPSRFSSATCRPRSAESTSHSNDRHQQHTSENDAIREISLCQFCTYGVCVHRRRRRFR